MNSRWKSTLAAFGAAGLTIAIAPFAVAEPVADEAPADQTTATAPAVTQEPAPVAPAPSTSNTAPTPTQSAPATTPSESSAPSSTASEAEGASSAATSASETSAEESESEAHESLSLEHRIGPEGDVMIIEDDGIFNRDQYITDGNPPVGVGPVSEEDVPLGIEPDPDLLEFFENNPNYYYDEESGQWYRKVRHFEDDPYVGSDWYWDNDKGEWVIDGSPDADNDAYVPMAEMTNADFLPGWYEHADGKWYPYPPFPGFPHFPGEYVDVCTDDWEFPDNQIIIIAGGGSGGGSSMAQQSEMVPFGSSRGRYQMEDSSVDYDPCAPVDEPPGDEPPVDEPPVDEPPAEEPSAEQPPVE